MTLVGLFPQDRSLRIFAPRTLSFPPAGFGDVRRAIGPARIAVSAQARLRLSSIFQPWSPCAPQHRFETREMNNFNAELVSVRSQRNEPYPEAESSDTIRQPLRQAQLRGRVVGSRERRPTRTRSLPPQIEKFSPTPLFAVRSPAFPASTFVPIESASLAARQCFWFSYQLQKAAIAAPISRGIGTISQKT